MQHLTAEDTSQTRFCIRYVGSSVLFNSWQGVPVMWCHTESDHREWPAWTPSWVYVGHSPPHNARGNEANVQSEGKETQLKSWHHTETACLNQITDPETNYHSQKPKMMSPPWLYSCKKNPTPPFWALLPDKIHLLMRDMATTSLPQHPGLTLPGRKGKQSQSPAWVDLGQPCLSEVPVKMTVVNTISQPRLGATFFSEVSWEEMFFHPNDLKVCFTDMPINSLVAARFGETPNSFHEFFRTCWNRAAL